MAISRTMKIGLAAGAALATAGLGLAFAANDPDNGPGRHHWQMMEGRHAGPGMMGGRLCASEEPMAPRFTARLESAIQPTDAQKSDFEALKTAIGKAEQTLKAACPTQAERDDRTPPARLALAEKRMAAGLDAIRTIRPPFDALYAKLDDKQRDRLRWLRPGPMFGLGGMGPR